MRNQDHQQRRAHVTRSTILLDLDGTIVDSRPGIAVSCKAALQSLGHDPAEVNLDGLIGPPLEEVLAVLLAPFGDRRVAEAARAYRTHYGSIGFLQTSVYACIAAALAQLSEAQLTLIIATSKRRAFAERIPEHQELSKHFQSIYGSEDDGR